MSISAERVVLIGPTQQEVILRLRDLTIPVQTVLRQGRMLVCASDERDLERVRGIGTHIWAMLPGHHLPDAARCFLSANRGREAPFHETIARHLAWRLWHADS